MDIRRSLADSFKIGGVYSAGGQLIVQEKPCSATSRKKRNILFGDSRYVVSKGQSSRSTANRRSENARTKVRSTLNWNPKDSSEEKGDRINEIAPSGGGNERVINSIYRSTSNGPIVHWKPRRRAQLIPRAKLRAPLPNYQHLQLSFSCENANEDHEPETASNKPEKHKKPKARISQMEPQMIRLKDTISPASHLHSEKIRISRDSAIFEIKRDLSEDYMNFSKQQELYDSVDAYRQLSVSSSASCTSSSCESSQSSCSSSGLSETTTYVTCCSEIEPVQMTGFQYLNDITQCQQPISVFEANGYDRISHEVTDAATSFSTCSKNTSTDEDSEREMVTGDKKEYSFYTGSSVGSESENSYSTKKPTEMKKESYLRAPKLLEQIIPDFENPKNLLQRRFLESPTKTDSKTGEDGCHRRIDYQSRAGESVKRCTSMLNLRLKHDPVAHSINAITKTTSESNLLYKDSGKEEGSKERIARTISIMLQNRQKQAVRWRQTKEKASNENLVADEEKLTNRNAKSVEPCDSLTYTSERSCRVTGEILKTKQERSNCVSEYTRNVCTLPRTVKSHRSQLQRHFYYPLHAAKSSNRVRDEELPDPDKVQHARDLFEKVLKVASLQNVNIAGNKNASKKGNWLRPTPENRQPDSGFVHRRLQKCFSADPGLVSNHHQAYEWIDNNSLSSGVGSDVSGETDGDTTYSKSDVSGSNSDSGGSKDAAIFSSDEDLRGGKNGGKDAGKPISQDVLKNIRAYGTSVTYFGGKIIDSSRGYSRSPMTMTIMNEIKQSSPDFQTNKKFLFDDKNLPTKLRLVKSISCGSGLQLSHTEEYGHEYEKKLAAQKNFIHNDMSRRNNIIEEEEEEEKEDVEEELKKKSQKIKQTLTEILGKISKINETHLRKSEDHPRQSNKSYRDMEFEEFQVLEEKR